MRSHSIHSLKLHAGGRRQYHNIVSSNLPAQIDLLERYRGLVSLGRIKEDEEQIRVIAQLRRLHRELEGYAPPALQSRHLNQTHSVIHKLPPNVSSSPWWAANDPLPTAPASSRGLVRILTHAEEIESLTTPKGLTITGPPGSGKSFLVDLWFSTVPTAYKTRKHYNALVLEVYRAVWEETRRRMAAVHTNPDLHDLHEAAAEEPSRPWTKPLRARWRQLLETGSLPVRWTRNSNMTFSLSRAPLEPSIAYVVAQRLLLRHWLLVFDEIQLLDVSSATLLADVLSWFWRMGGIVVGTSNKVPDDLYKNGVQRERLEPFVEALKARCPVVVMGAERDWRAVRGSEGKSSWYTFDERRDFEAAVAEVSRIRSTGGTESEEPLLEASPSEIMVFGRSIRVPWSTSGVCQFTFSQLCDESLGPADYITLAANFHTFVIRSIPVLKLSAKNQARRFISLIDALYEARCRIVCLAEASPNQLFFPDAPHSDSNTDSHPSREHTSTNADMMMAEAVGETQDVYRPNVSSYDSPHMARERTPTKTLALDTLSIFSGKDEQFAFKRALSRLFEMTSEGYARDEQWAPLPPDARKWEAVELPSQPPITTPPPSTSTPSATAAAQPRLALVEADNNTSISFSNDECPTSASALAERPPAPRLSAHHVWGVREDWGARAGDWGRGAALHGNHLHASGHEPTAAAQGDDPEPEKDVSVSSDGNQPQRGR